MMKFFAKIIFFILSILNNVISFLTKKDFINYLYDFLRQNYSKKKNW